MIVNRLRLRRFGLFIILCSLVMYGACGGGGGGDETPPVKSPVAPAVTAASGQLTVTWSAVDGATAYQVWYNTADDSATAVKFGGDFISTACLITGLSNGTAYHVWVKILYGDGTNEFSPSAVSTPVATALSLSDIMFIYGGGSSDNSILRMNDSAGTTQIVAPLSDVLMSDLTYAPDRKKIAYVNSSDEYVKFHDSGTGTTTDITPSGFRYFGDYRMALSPDGAKLAYINYDSHSHIWVIPTGTAGSTPAELTNCTTGYDNYPVWSPDGTRLAFVHADADYNAKIYSIKADGSGGDPYANLLYGWNTTSTGNESLMDIAWSPVNPYQMVCAMRISAANPRFSMYLLNLTTGERTKLTNDTGNHELFPCWSRDGNYIFYQINNDIYYKSIDNPGTAGTRVTNDGKSSVRGWSPS